MPALDTNILVRYLMADDAAQAAATRHLFKATADAEERLHIAVTVVLELEWVLRTRYAFDKMTWSQALTELLESVELEFASESAIESALRQYLDSSADFADCLHAALSRDHPPWWTFDRTASRIDGAKLLTTSR